MSSHPRIVWAEREEYVYLTVEVVDAKDVSLEMAPFKFKCTSGGTTYEESFELAGEIVADESTQSTKPRAIELKLKKKESGYWNKLHTGKKMQNVAVDWNKWVDEDEDGASGDVGGFGDMGDMSSMMGGMGGMGGMMGALDPAVPKHLVEPVTDLHCALLNNMASILMNSGKLDRAVDRLTETLKLRPKDTKALARRAKAYWKANKLDGCSKDVDALLALEPDHKEGLKLRKQVDQRFAEYDKKQANMFKGMFS
mmetsp:Transcript_39070/g.54496  ORF Transcript_39070/g.54496 Transcript_39070/m.54496 type:complete len:254 (-) Transcript_39070:59-820(-)